MISFRQKGDFSKTSRFLKNASEIYKNGMLDKYCLEGVRALSDATPKDTGKTASSWDYDVTHKKGVITVSFKNTNVQNGVPIAIILQYGHATKNGGWVEGRDYINPAVRPVFDKITNELWKEVTKP